MVAFRYPPLAIDTVEPSEILSAQEMLGFKELVEEYHAHLCNSDWRRKYASVEGCLTTWIIPLTKEYPIVVVGELNRRITSQMFIRQGQEYADKAPLGKFYLYVMFHHKK